MTLISKWVLVTGCFKWSLQDQMLHSQSIHQGTISLTAFSPHLDDKHPHIHLTRNNFSHYSQIHKVRRAELGFEICCIYFKPNEGLCVSEFTWFSSNKQYLLPQWIWNKTPRTLLTNKWQYLNLVPSAFCFVQIMADTLVGPCHRSTLLFLENCSDFFAWTLLLSLSKGLATPQVQTSLVLKLSPADWTRCNYFLKYLIQQC